ncbi:MAG: BatD family protein [bacterium]
MDTGFDLMRLYGIMGIVLGSLFLVSQPVPADRQSPVVIESNVDKAEVTVGDPIHYTINLMMEKGITILWPQFGTELGQFEIQEYQRGDPTEQEGLISQSIMYTIAAYDTGSYRIPPVKFPYRTKEGKEGAVSTEEIEILVKAVAPEDAADIKDIKGPLSMKGNWFPSRRALLWFGLVLCIVFLILGARWYLRKKGSPQPVHSDQPLPPPHEVALAELKRIWDIFLKEKQIKEFYLQLSEILRQYLSRRYQITALEETTEELLRELHKQSLHWQQRSLISNFLADCDIVKFARYIPSPEETEKTYHMAFQIIDVTKAVADTSMEPKEHY